MTRQAMLANWRTVLTDSQMSRRVQKLVLYMAVGAFVLVFLKNAWVGEDAYITFRSIEQLFAGHGPRWNPHERVQVFTSPLWFWVLSGVRLASPDVFMNAIVASAILCLLLILTLRTLFKDDVRLLLAIMLLMCSNGFFDFTTSGLENPLGYSLIGVYFLCYHRLAREGPEKASASSLIGLLACFGLTVLCRHDLVTLLFLPTAYVCWSCRKMLPARKWCGVLSIALSPLIVWSVFALVYYGSVFPNTAYAKLPPGIDRLTLWRRGIAYLFESVRCDTVTLPVIGLVVGYTWLSSRRSSVFLGLGIAANLLYVVSIGGDFMQGRFLSYAYLVAVLTFLAPGPPRTQRICQRVVPWLRSRRPTYNGGFATLFAVCLLYMLFYPHTPANSSVHYENTQIVRGIEDERGFYFATSSLWQHLFKNTEAYFPAHLWSKLGYGFSTSSSRMAYKAAIGYFGYWAGSEKIIVDHLGLGDPLLARLPTIGWFGGQVGHYRRRIPAGYEESILDNSAQLQDPGLNEFYKKIRMATQSERLFSLERMKTILALNLGLYDHLIDPDYD